MSDDFVNFPIRKLTNRENIFTRVDKVEKRTGARASATAVQLSQIAKQTGDLIVDGSIVIYDRATGEPSLLLFDTGITIKNDFTGLSFGVSDPALSVYLKTDTSDNLWIANRVPGKEVRIITTHTDASTPAVTIEEDPSNANVSRMDLAKGTAGGKISIGTSVILWGGKDGENTSFNATLDEVGFYVYGTNATPVLRVGPTDNLAYYNGKEFPSAGTWTPTFTLVANLDSASALGLWKYSRIDDIVTFTGAMTLDATAAAATQTQVGISLPLASDFTLTTDAAGGGSDRVNNTASNISSDATNNRMTMTYNAVVTTSTTWRVWGQYEMK
jgi:hypothetical protein